MQEFEDEVVETVLHHRTAKSVRRDHFFLVEQKELMIFLPAERTVEALPREVQELEGFFGV